MAPNTSADEEMRTRILDAVWMKTGGMDSQP
jgi:hypothetical protein